MPGSTFGKIFRITTYGESHGKAIGVVIDGCPPGVHIEETDINNDLKRRRPGSSKITTDRKENDEVEILSGVFENKSLGTPISLLIRNDDQKSDDYEKFRNVLRPSHADYSYLKKYGIFTPHGGGRASARETAARVAAGSIAMQILKKEKIEIIAYTKQIYDIAARINAPCKVTRQQIEKNLVRCPDHEAAKDMEELILGVKHEGDSVGGIIECIIKNTPAGLGDPVFDKLEADLGKAMLSIPATKGIEFGSGFSSIYKKGSENNDAFIKSSDGRVITETNNSGGIQGGISNGMDILFRVAFKPTATITKLQKTITTDEEETLLRAVGRHDPCVIPRAVPIIEAMAAIVLADHYLIQKTIS